MPAPLTEPAWLVRALSDLEAGVAEIPGKANHPRIMEMYATVGHPEIESETTSWCAAATGTWLKESGFPIPPKATNLMGVSYATYGVPLDTFKPGCICVFYYTAKREKDWRRHVCIGVRETKTHIIAVGGNQSNSVCEQRLSKRELVAMRWPVAATVKDLRDAGSADIGAADTLKRVAIGTIGTAAAGAASNEATAPAPQPVIPAVDLQSATEQLGMWQTLMEGMNAIAKLVGAHPWLVACALGAAGLYWLARKIEGKRIERANLGHPLSVAG